MGSFPGHVVPGSFLMLQSLWWMANISMRRATSIKMKLPFRSSTWFLWNRYPNVPVEPILNFFLFSSLSVTEVVTALQPTAFEWSNTQHMAMYVMIIITSIVQMAQFRCKDIIPAGFDYLCGISTAFINIIQLLSHLHGRPPVDVMLHMLIVYGVGGFLCSMVFELLYRCNPLFAMFRAMFLFLVGLNFIHTGFILFPPGGDAPLMELKGHYSMSKVSALFGFELAFTFIVAITVNILVFLYYSVDNVYVKAIRQQSGYQKEENSTNLPSENAIFSPEYCVDSKHYSIGNNNHKMQA